MNEKPLHSPLLAIKKISCSYGPISALQGVSLEVYPGEIVTLIGSNGAGKSTLLMSLFSQPRILEGQILFDGADISALPTHEVCRRSIALVPEGRRIFPKMSVEENLIMGTIASNGAGIEEGIERSYNLFPRLKERRDQNAGTMSGGEQQMLAIARALMSRPRLLLLDEPSLGLAPLIVNQIFQTLQEIRDDGTTIFLVEQNAAKALKIADRGYVLVNGMITLTDQASKLLANPKVKAAYLGH